jgi:N-acetylglutamate synthase-like GNAT family acetyltransferase
MCDFTIRPYASSDLEPCRALWAELTQHHRDIYGDPTIGGETPGLHFDPHLARVGPERIWVAEQDGRIVGLTGLIVEGQEGELEPLVVALASRRQGIGRALASHVIQEASKLKVRTLSVRPVARNADAITFFYDAGFGVLGHIELFMDLGEGTAGTWRSGPELLGRAFKY